MATVLLVDQITYYRPKCYCLKCYRPNKQMSSSVDALEESIFRTDVHRKDILAKFTTNLLAFISKKY